MIMTAAMVTKSGILSMQICVPAAWTDDEAERYANTHNPAGTTNGWRMRKQGDERLAGADARVPCGGADARPGCVHIMLDC